MIIKVVLDILGQPLYLCLFILHKIQTTFPIVSDSFMGKRAIEAAAVGGLVGWVVLAIIVAAVIFVAVKYVLEDAFSGAGTWHEFYAALAGVFWRLIGILVVYAVLSVLIYAFINFTHLISSEMNYVPPAK